eukprot:1136404-Pelagomonas_calceolata.AAC.3
MPRIHCYAVVPPCTPQQAEQEEAGEEAAPAPEEGSEDEDEFIYNPLKLPLGWDGKPIPYWLYKLHGLNQEFKCEICGNYSYWGRWSFAEWWAIPCMLGLALGTPIGLMPLEALRME